MCGRSLFGCVPTTRVVAEASSSVVLYVVSSTEQNFPSVPSSHRCPESGDLPARYAQTVEYLSSRWRTGLTAELSDNHHATIQYHLDHHDESSLAFGYAITETASGQAEGTVMVKATFSGAPLRALSAPHFPIRPLRLLSALGRV